MHRERGYGFVIAAFALAVGAAGLLAFAPLGASVTEVAVPEADTNGDGLRPQEDVTHTSLVEEQGWSDLARIGVLLLLVAGAPLLAPSGRRARVLRGASTVLLFGGVIAGILSVGIFLLPAAILMLIATALSLSGRDEPTATRGARE
jgi:hypothetical protein